MKKYTKRQIQEAIRYWKARLNEAAGELKPMTGKQFVDMIKAAKAEGAQTYSFRYQNPTNKGNGTQPIKISRWTGENLADGFQLGISGGLTLGRVGDFKDLLFMLKDICSNKGKTLTALCGRAKKVGFSYRHDSDVSGSSGSWSTAKDITYPIVRTEIGTAYGDARKQLFIYVLDPHGPGVEKPKPEPDDDSWI